MKKLMNAKTILTAFLFAGLSVAAAQAEETNVSFSGSYQGAQIIPNEMAIFCQISGEDVYNDVSKIRPCLNSIIAKMHNSDAQAAKEGKEDWERIRLDQLNVVMGDAVAKTAYDADYTKDQNEIQEQGAKTQTEHEDVAAIAYAITSLTDNVSRLISLTAQNLKYGAIEGLALVDPNVAGEVQEDANAEGGTTVTSDVTTAVTTEPTPNVQTQEEITAVVPTGNDETEANGDDANASSAASTSVVDASTPSASGESVESATPSSLEDVLGTSEEGAEDSREEGSSGTRPSSDDEELELIPVQVNTIK